MYTYITLCTSCNSLRLQSQFDLITPIVIPSLLHTTRRPLQLTSGEILKLCRGFGVSKVTVDPLVTAWQGIACTWGRQQPSVDQGSPKPKGTHDELQIYSTVDVYAFICTYLQAHRLIHKQLNQWKHILNMYKTWAYWFQSTVFHFLLICSCADVSIWNDQCLWLKQWKGHIHHHSSMYLCD